MNILQNILTGEMNNEELEWEQGLGKERWTWEQVIAARVCDIMMKSVTLYADLKTYIEKCSPHPAWVFRQDFSV